MRADVVQGNLPGVRKSSKTFPCVLCGVLVQIPICAVAPRVAFVHRPSWMRGAGKRRFWQVPPCSRPTMPSVRQVSDPVMLRSYVRLAKMNCQPLVKKSTRLSPSCRQSAVFLPLLSEAAVSSAGQKNRHVVSWQPCWDDLQSAPCFPGHARFFDNVMHSHRSHPVIQRARSAMW